MGDKIEVHGAVKKFREFTALDHISINFEKGKIHGIIGRNGSGKTVLFKCICGLLRLSEGEILVDDKRMGTDMDILPNVGIIIENPGFLSGYNAYRNLEFLAMINGKIGKKEIDSAIEKVGLDARSKKKVGKYSMGMKQRLGIAQAIMENPDLLILDEPMNGLDNQGVADIRTLLLELKRQGKTILLSSHNKEDISVLCDTVAEMDHGQIIRRG